MSGPFSRLRSSSLLFLPYLLGLFSPNLLGLYIEQDPLSLVIAVLAFILIVAAHLAFNWSRWLVAAMLPFFLLLPFDLYYIWHYHETLSPHVFAIALQSPHEQIVSYLMPRTPALVAGLSLSLLIWGMAFLPKGPKETQSVPRLVIRGMCFAVLLATFVVSAMLWQEISGASRTDTNPSAATVAGRLVAASFPLGRTMNWCRYLSQKERMIEAAKARRSARLGVRVKPGSVTENRPVIVMVLGESANPRHWALYGYMRNTTPLLSARKDLFVFRDMVSPWPSTMQAVPTILTRKSATDSRVDSVDPTLILSLKEAGFKTVWLSNQGSSGRFDLTISELAADADERHFIQGPAAMRPGRPGDDAALIPLAESVIKANSGPLLLVLHTQGSHYPYWERYPSAFEKFLPAIRELSFNDRSNDPAYRKALINAYDNSVAYTDLVLDRLLTLFEASGRDVRLVYVADHGESLPTAKCQRFGHGFKSPSNFRIPGFVWLSPVTREQEPALAKHLYVNLQQRTSSAHVFATVLDLAGVEAQALDAESSLLSEKFKPGTRWVNAPAPVDFDAHTFQGPCE